MKKLRVLQVVPSFNVGGAEGLVLTYLRNFDSSCMDMKAVSFYLPSGSIYDEIINDEKLPVAYLNKKGPLDITFVKQLKAEIESFNPDVIHTHMSALKYVVMAGTLGKPIFHTIHSEVLTDAGIYDRVVNRFLFKKYKVTPIALHEELRTAVNRYYGCTNTVVVSNGIDVDKFKNGVSIRDELGISGDSFVLCHVGSFSKPKNHEFLIKVFKKVLSYKPNACLALVGGGVLEDSIRKLVADEGLDGKVLFLGRRSDINNVLKSSDVFVFPSLYEGFGIAVLEAEASGIPAVVSDKVPASICKANNIKLLSLNTDLSEWCDTILKLEGEHDESVNKSIEEYDINNILKELYDVYLYKIDKHN